MHINTVFLYLLTYSTRTKIRRVPASTLHGHVLINYAVIVLSVVYNSASDISIAPITTSKKFGQLTRLKN